jgi:hypothetical protein
MTLFYKTNLSLNSHSFTRAIEHATPFPEQNVAVRRTAASVSLAQDKSALMTIGRDQKARRDCVSVIFL